MVITRPTITEILHALRDGHRVEYRGHYADPWVEAKRTPADWARLRIYGDNPQSDYRIVATACTGQRNLFDGAAS